MIVYNYSSLRTRETKLYSVGGYNMSGGLSIEFLKVTGPVAVIIIAIGFALSFVFGINFYNPMDPTFKLPYTLTWLILGIAIGCALWFVRFAGYRLYQYLLAYIRPKKAYRSDFKIKEYKFHSIKVKSIVKNIL